MGKKSDTFQNVDYAYRYGDARKLYLNVTNRCTNRCAFCVRYATDGLGGALLWGGVEPDLLMLRRAVGTYGGLQDFREFIWCGFGEPTFRLDLMLEAAPWLRSRGARIRLNTNGHACLIHGRDVLPELSPVVDSISISMNAPDCSRYLELCRPETEAFGLPPESFWDATLDCLTRSSDYFESVQASVVGAVLTLEEFRECRNLAGSQGIRQFRVR